MGSVPRAGRSWYLAVQGPLTASVAAGAADLLRGYIWSTASSANETDTPGLKAEHKSASLLGVEGPARLSSGCTERGPCRGSATGSTPLLACQVSPYSGCC